MRQGDTLAVALGNVKVDFTEEFASDDMLPTKAIFNRPEWIKEENYIKIVREEEMFTMGNLNQGHFHMSPDFQMCLISESQDDETVKHIIDHLPHKEHFKFFQVA